MKNKQRYAAQSKQKIEKMTAMKKTQSKPVGDGEADFRSQRSGSVLEEKPRTKVSGATYSGILYL
jgi:hypothetical protein